MTVQEDDMATYEEIAKAVFGREVMDEIYDIYNARKGGYENVDRAAIKRVFDRFPNATDKEKNSVEMWAAVQTR